jgi:hypothetical protein
MNNVNTMNHGTLLMVFWILACLLASYMLVRHFRAYIDAIFARAPGQSWPDVFRKGNAEHEMNQRAKLEMFGSKWVTIGGHLLLISVLFLSLSLTAYAPYWALLMVAYFAWGLYDTQSLGFDENKSYKRLLKRDKLSYRLVHAALWPWHRSRSKG